MKRKVLCKDRGKESRELKLQGESLYPFLISGMRSCAFVRMGDNKKYFLQKDKGLS